MNWIQISPDDAQSLYGIPAEIANAEGNTFFGFPIELPYGYDVSRPLLAFIRSKEHPDVVTIYIQTIEPETWEYHGMLPNPLTMSGGLLSLDKGGLKDLVKILESYQRHFKPLAHMKQQVFKPIEGTKLFDLRLHPEWFPKTIRKHYIQVYEPLSEAVETRITILILSKGNISSKIGIQITQFSLLELQDLHFEPLYSGYSRINLNRDGFQEVTELLNNEIRNLK